MGWRCCSGLVNALRWECHTTLVVEQGRPRGSAVARRVAALQSSQRALHAAQSQRRLRDITGPAPVSKREPQAQRYPAL
jgi:hypothetical protein